MAGGWWLVAGFLCVRCGFNSLAPALLATKGLPLAVSRAVTLTAWVPFGSSFGCSFLHLPRCLIVRGVLMGSHRVAETRRVGFTSSRGFWRDQPRDFGRRYRRVGRRRLCSGIRVRERQKLWLGFYRKGESAILEPIGKEIVITIVVANFGINIRVMNFRKILAPIRICDQWHAIRSCRKNIQKRNANNEQNAAEAPVV